MHKTLRVMACAPAYGAPGDIAKNTQAILERIEQAREDGVQLLVLPELCLTGSGIYGLLSHQVLAQACMEAAQKITTACGSMLCVFGLPVWGKQSSLPYDALALVQDGSVQGLVLKEHLQKEQLPYFLPGKKCKLSFLGRQIPCHTEGSLPLHAEGSLLAVRFFDDLQPNKPLAAQLPPTLLALCGLQPAEAGLLSLFADNLKQRFQGKTALVYANAGANESSTDWVYPGEAAIVQNGKVLSQAPAFSNQTAMADVLLSLDEKEQQNRQGFGVHIPWDRQLPYAPAPGTLRTLWARDCIEIAARGLATRMQRINCKAATLGVSGGLDSTLALLITRRAFDILGLPREDIYGYSLPGLGSSLRTRSNALQLLKALGLVPREIDIRPSILQHFGDIGQNPDVHDIAYENAQARERSQLLMDKANQLGGLMVGSGDLSELALGFTTFGGDHLSNYSVNAGLYKSAIRLIVAQAAADADNQLMKTTLLDILDTPISPELVPGQDGQIVQKTEEVLGPYPLNDFFLHGFLYQQATPQILLILTQAAFGGSYSRGEILARMRAFFVRFFRNQFKRNCLPDGPAVLGVSLSPRGGFALASDASASAWLAAIDQLIGEE